MAETAYLVEPGFVRSVVIGHLPGRPSVRALFYPDGKVGIEHRCKIVDGTQIICAPALRLGEGHTIISDDPLTVTPSISCPDCGLHGFITDGRWIDA